MHQIDRIEQRLRTNHCYADELLDDLLSVLASLPGLFGLPLLIPSLFPPPFPPPPAPPPPLPLNPPSPPPLPPGPPPDFSRRTNLPPRGL